MAVRRSLLPVVARGSAAGRIALPGLLSTAILLGVCAAESKDAAVAKQEWSSYGGEKAFQRYSALSQIDKSNVGTLKVVWTRPGLDTSITEKFPDLEPSAYFRGTPIMVGDVLFAPDAVGLVEAFDAVTGATKWVQAPIGTTMKDVAGQSTRGVAYWKKGGDERIVSIRGEYLYALDAKTGAPIKDFGEGGRVSLNRHTPDAAKYFGFGGPYVFEDVIVVGGNGGGSPGGYGDGGFAPKAVPEDIRGYDVVTGKQLWQFHILPHKGEPGYDTWGKGSAEYAGNMGAWASMSADEKLGLVYVPLSTPTGSYYGGHRPGDNLYSNSVVALNIKTGKLAWYYQMVHHDLWEYDASVPPVVCDITVDGKKIKALAASNKTAWVYVLDRATGKPVWPIPEKPVPQSTLPGEATSPTQPMPSKPPAYDLQGLTDDDLIDYTPELHAKALEIAHQYVMGPIFNPPVAEGVLPEGKKGAIISPGGWGAGNWNTPAFDPETGIYYAVSQTGVGASALTKNPDASNPMLYGAGHAAPPANRPAPADGGHAAPPAGRLTIEGLPIFKGPYGRITALDLNKGTKLWTVPNGDGPINHPLIKDLHLSPMGNAGRPAPLLTKSLLFLGDASDAVMGHAGISGNTELRAYDKATGAVVAHLPIPAGTTGAPMTYMVKGKQYIVVPIGSERVGTKWVAFALP